MPIRGLVADRAGGAVASTGSAGSISGLASGIDTASIVSKLMQIEARPQTLLKSQLSTAQTTARALRELNTALATLSSAAQALTGSSSSLATSATSSSRDVVATATAAAQPGGSLTFTVTSLAATQTSISSATWSSRTGDVRTAAGTGSDPLPAWPITVLAADGSSDTVDVPAGASLDDAAAAINAKKNLGLSAAVIKLDNDHYTLQVTSTTTGTSHGFTLLGAGEDPSSSTPSFTTLSPARDAKLTIGSTTATSPSNTFTDLLTGVSVTVSQVSATPTTVTVGTDTASTSGKVQALVSAANTALTTIARYTDSSPGSTAPLKGNPTLTGLASRILSQISTAVGGMSPAAAGLQINRDGGLTFDAAKFGALLQADPETALRIFGGGTGPGRDGRLHTADDTVDTDGLAARLFVIAMNASDSTTGMITTLANGQDDRVKSLQKNIDSWAMRLDQREQLLTRRFQAMETALGRLNSQSSWLSAQINQLPSWNTGTKK